jgi:segregation and condensation protein B
MSETLTPPPADAAAERPREKRAEKILPALEALLFSSARPVKKKDLAEALEATPDAVAEGLRLLAEGADRPERGVRLESVADGWRFVTRPEFDAMLRKFHDVSERSRLSLAALETLAIIAYRQPITLPEIQEIRGVNSASVLNTLFEKKLITTAGRRSVVGSPFLYRTTPDFLVRFGLKDVDELPRPEELAEDLSATVGDAPPASLPDAISAATVEEDEEDEDEDLDDEDFDEEDGEADEAAEDDGEDDAS